MKVVKGTILLLCLGIFFAGVAWGGHATAEAEQNSLYVPTEAWQQVASGGVNDAGNEMIVSMQEFENNLYAGTSNAGGASVLRSLDGETWSAVETGGFTDASNQQIYGLTEYDGSLYAATGTVTDTNHQAELWASQTGNNGTWQEVLNTGLGANQGAYRSLLTYQDSLWVGTSATGGMSAELWTYDSGTWTQQVIPAFDTSGTNTGILSLMPFGGDLYIGTSNPSSGAEVWRYDGNDSSWQRVAQNGFGTPANESIYTMQVYNGQLYVGTLNTMTGAELYVTQDGISWQQVFANGFDNADNEAIWNLYEANGYLYLATENSVDGGRLYRTTDGHSWTPIALSGFGDPDNTLVRSMFAFESANGLHLYAGTKNENDGAEIWRTAVPQPEESWEQVERAGFDDDLANNDILDYVEFEGALYAALANATGTQVWRSTDGRNWTQVGSDGFGDEDNMPKSGYSLTVHENELYVGTGSDNGGVVYRLSNGAEWEAVSLPGFGDDDNKAVFKLASFNNSLYAGTWNAIDRAEVWRYTGTGTNWNNVSPPDMNFEDDNDSISSMVVYNGALYIGTANSTGGELWRTSDGTTWQALQTDGQGDTDNQELRVLYPFDGALYAGYSNDETGGQVWRSADGQTGWTQVNQGGFGANGVDDSDNRDILSMTEWRGYLYVGTQNPITDTTGGEIWRTFVGATQADWEQVNTDGFSFEENIAISSLEVFEDQLYAGTANSTTGAEVWRTTRPDQGPNDPCCQVVKVGLELQGAGWIRVNDDATTPIWAPQAGIYDVPLPGAGTYDITVEYVEGNQAVVQPITALVDEDGDVQLTHEAIVPLTSRVPQEAWSQVADEVQIGDNNKTIVAMQQFGNFLYGSTINTADGASIVRSTDGVAWNAVVTGGFGDDSNTGIYDMVEYNGQLYAGTVRITDTSAAELYRSTTGNLNTWQEVENTGLAAVQHGYSSLLPYDDPIVGREILWAGTVSTDTTSAELWYYDSSTEDWTQESIPGFDVDSHNKGIHTIEVFEDDLYIGTENNTTGAEVWRRSATDGSWSKIVQNGFLASTNTMIYDSAVYNNVLYLGTKNENGAELYATRDGESWEQIFDGGFDDSANTAIWSFFEANGYLYLGTESATGGRVYRTVDGNTWSPVSLPGFGNANNTHIRSMSTFDVNGDSYLYAGTTNTDTMSAEIWRTIIPQPQESWQQVERDGIDDAHDDPNNIAIESMVEYDNAIYVGTQISTTTGAQVWRSQEGGTWIKIGPDGLDDNPNDADNTSVDSLAVHNNELYAGVRNEANGGRVYHWDDDSGTWVQVNSDGFDGTSNLSVVGLHAFNGQLYASTNNVDGAKVYRYGGIGTKWTDVSSNANFESSNISILAMLVYDNDLYIGTENNSGGGEIWRYDGSTWQAITTDGFGDSNSQRVEAFAEFDGYLYASFANTADGGEIWRSQSGDNSTWEQVNQNGFGLNMVDDSDNESITTLAVWQGKLYAATKNADSGSEVWASATASTQADWEQVNTDGFGYQANIRSVLLGFGNHLYAGTENSTGAELWRTGLPDTSGERFAQVVNVTLRTNQATTINVTGQSNQSIEIPARGLYKLALPATGLYNIDADCGKIFDIALDVPLGPQLTSFTFDNISDQFVNDPFAITINALDENDNPIAITGTMTLSDSTGTLLPTQVSFNNQSSTTISVTIGISATNVVITGTYDDITGTSNAFDVTVPELTSLIFNPISDQLVNDAFAITIDALDQNNDPIAITGTMTLSDSTGTLSPTQVNFNNESSITLSVTIDTTATDVVITGSYDDITGTSNAFDVTEPPEEPEPSSFTFSPISDQLVNDAFAITIDALDQNNDPIAITGTMTLSDSTGTLSPTQVTFNNESSITLDVTIGISATDVVITGSYDNIEGTSNTFDVTEPLEVPELTSFTFNPISEQVANDPFAITINALDQNENPIAITGNMTLSDSTGTLSPTQVSFNNESSITIDATIDITATDVVITGSYDNINGTSNAFDVTEPPVLTSFTFDNISEQVANEPFAITINALDENDNPIAITGNMTLSDSTGSLSPTMVNFNNESSITIDATIDITATDVVITGSYDNINGTSNAFDVTTAPQEPEVTSFIFNSFNSISDQVVNEPFTITINALDQNDNPIAITGTMTLNDSTGTLEPTQVNFNNQSSITLEVTIGMAATEVVITGSYGDIDGTSNLFNVTEPQPENQIYLPIIRN